MIIELHPFIYTHTHACMHACVCVYFVRKFCLKYKSNPAVNNCFLFPFGLVTSFSVMTSYLLSPSLQISPWHHLTHQLSVTSVFMSGDSPSGCHSELVALQICWLAFCLIGGCPLSDGTWISVLV